MSNEIIKIPTEHRSVSLMAKGLYLPSAAAIALGFSVDQLSLQHPNSISFHGYDYVIYSQCDKLVAVNMKETVERVSLITGASVDEQTVVEANTPELARSVDAELETIFNGLAKNWREATGGYSLTMRRYAHASYQSILALEPKKDVISLILCELQQRPDRWFEALKALTKTNPAQDAETFDETVQRWIEWGKREKYIS